MTYQGTGVNTTLDQLVAQLAAQHTATAAKLDALITALGAPPPTGTVTLADVLSAIELTNSRLTTLAGYLSTIATQSNLTRVALDSFIDDWNSGSGGLQYLENIMFAVQDARRAIIATACPCTGDNPVLPAPGNTTPFPTAEQQLKCKRAQRFVDWFLQEVLIRVMDTYSTYGFVGTAAIGAVLTVALVALAPETAGASLLPTVAIASIVALLGSLSSSMLGGIVSYYNTTPVKQTLISAIYNAPSAVEAKSSFDTSIDTFTSIPSPIRAVWKALALQLFFDQTFDLTRTIDVAGYNGTVCGGNGLPVGHTVITIAARVWPPNFGYYIEWPNPPFANRSNTGIPPYGTSPYPFPVFVTSQTSNLYVRYVTAGASVSCGVINSQGAMAGVSPLTTTFQLIPTGTYLHCSSSAPFTIELGMPS